MTVATPPRRVSQALMNSLAAGVVPRSGLEYIAVGRKEEIEALLRDVQGVGEGGASFRLIVGRYGSGKSFLLQLLRNYALERGYAVADADLSPERRLAGSGGQGAATYRELVKNLSTKARPDGGAIGAILERWISGVQVEVAAAGTAADSPGFNAAVEAKIVELAGQMQDLVNGFEFAKVILAYWRGYQQDDDELRDAALRWLRGEFTTKTDARKALDVRVIVDDDTWYDHLKLLARFVAAVGYKGLLVVIDEAVNLYKIVSAVSREGNYEKLLAMFNDTMQGRAEHLGLFFAGTPQFLEDPRRGLYSYEALRSRLSDTRFVRDGLRDTAGPVLRLPTLTHEEIFVLLGRIASIHRAHYSTTLTLTAPDLEAFLEETLDRVGSDALLTPRPVIRDFIALLNILQQHPELSLKDVLKGADFTPQRAPGVEEVTAEDFAEFTL